MQTVKGGGLFEFKKKPRTPKEEIARAWRIYEEDGAQAKLMIVRKT